MTLSVSGKSSYFIYIHITSVWDCLWSRVRQHLGVESQMGTLGGIKITAKRLELTFMLKSSEKFCAGIF